METILDKIEYFENILSGRQMEVLHGYLGHNIWHKNQSNRGDIREFWGIRGLENDPFFHKECLDTINELTNRTFKLDHVLINAQSTLQDGTPHCDFDGPNAYTFIIYINHDWDIQWGGQTIFLDRYKDTETKEEVVLHRSRHKTFFPVPNAGLLFPANIYHFAFGPTREFYGKRLTAAFKLLLEPTEKPKQKRKRSR